MIILIDNYDSFTFNIFYYIKGLIPDVKVVKNTESVSYIKNLQVDGIILSPGPSSPDKGNLSFDAIDYYHGKVPILGVCLGMQFIGYYFGAQIRKAKKIMHGKVDTIAITCRDCKLLKGINDEFLAVRYHSLVVDKILNLRSCAYSKSDSEIMSIDNKELEIYGVQFHPESYMTKNGIIFFKNFLEVVYDERDFRRYEIGRKFVKR